MQKWLFSIAAVVALVLGVLLYQANLYDFKTLSGEKHRWSSFSGEWVVVNYFAEWCAPCLREVPELNLFAEWTGTQSDVHLVAISYDDLDQVALQGLATQYNMQFELLLPTETKFVPIDKPQYLPATFIIKPDGSVTPPLLGEQTSASLQAAIAQLKQTL
ncbi:TlpA family protein disulfide reductase [Alteromonas facilis]|uniref:TlpA family protein disulfide reductase n=1 Tax=Alteromonas facilis TaxID=2048004 RepID=UPI0013DD2119|nr:TlpA disulfide reductase family protein [Alteromonas facilis]